MRNVLSRSVVVIATLVVSGSVVFGQDVPHVINGGIVNGKAKTLPKPEYPEQIRAVGIEGRVRVRVLIDEEGNVISAEPILSVESDKNVGLEQQTEVESPHPLLQEAAREAAFKAKFAPTTLSGFPVRVSGIITYNFVAGEPQAPDISKSLQGGALNIKAVDLPSPAYPKAARAVRASGAVTVQVLIDENGNIEYAGAVSGHPLLRAAAVEAAKNARFSPTMINGTPIKVSGVLTYNFVLPEVDDQ
jgi:TonB family protein